MMKKISANHPIILQKIRYINWLVSWKRFHARVPSFEVSWIIFWLNTVNHPIYCTPIYRQNPIDRHLSTPTRNQKIRKIFNYWQFELSLLFSSIFTWCLRLGFLRSTLVERLTVKISTVFCAHEKAVNRVMHSIKQINTA